MLEAVLSPDECATFVEAGEKRVPTKWTRERGFAPPGAPADPALGRA